MSYQSYCITTLACSLNGEVGGGGKVKDDLLNTSHAKTLWALLHFRQNVS